VLGSLLKGSAAIGIWPRPEVPYHGITFKSLASQVREMQVLDNCNQRDRYYSSGNGHGVKDAIEASIRSLEDQFCGLKLGSFLPEAQNRKKSKADKKKWKKKVDKN
jgi:predicted DNA-binding protein